MSFHDIYRSQEGRGGRGVDNVFVGSHRQRGHGLGSFFTGLFRSALPYIAKGASAVGKEALRAGVNIIEDVGDYNMTLKDSLRNRMKESGKNLKRKATDKIVNMMSGSGYKTLPYKMRRQSRGAGGRQRTSKVKKTKRVTKRGGVRKIKKQNKNKKRRVKKTRKSRAIKRKVQKRKNKNTRDIFD